MSNGPPTANRSSLMAAKGDCKGELPLLDIASGLYEDGRHLAAFGRANLPLFLGDSMMRSLIQRSLLAAAVAALLVCGSSRASAGDEPTTKGKLEAAERQAVYAHLEEMKKRIEQFEKEGKHEDAARLKHELSDMMQHLRQHSEGQQGGQTENMLKGGPAEIGQRIEHLRQAAQHLAAAGMKSDAERMATMAQRMENYLKGQSRPNPEARPLISVMIR